MCRSSSRGSCCRWPVSIRENGSPLNIRAAAGRRCPFRSTASRPTAATSIPGRADALTRMTSWSSCPRIWATGPRRATGTTSPASGRRSASSSSSTTSSIPPGRDGSISTGAASRARRAITATSTPRRAQRPIRLSPPHTGSATTPTAGSIISPWRLIPGSTSSTASSCAWRATPVPPVVIMPSSRIPSTRGSARPGRGRSG
ncbi:MAG: hypothetical protein BWY77_00952 [bacterium ADurb.Bin431]|nr:MAG: hypothetical protein BWY77_00952 [bacterium ADurb.Bin431]